LFFEKKTVGNSILFKDSNEIEKKFLISKQLLIGSTLLFNLRAFCCEE